MKDGGGIAYVWMGALAVTSQGVRNWIWNGTGESGSFPVFWIGNVNGNAVFDRFVNWGGKSAGKFNEPDNFTDKEVYHRFDPRIDNQNK